MTLDKNTQGQLVKVGMKVSLTTDYQKDLPANQNMLESIDLKTGKCKSFSFLYIKLQV